MTRPAGAKAGPEEVEKRPVKKSRWRQVVFRSTIQMRTIHFSQVSRRPIVPFASWIGLQVRALLQELAESLVVPGLPFGRSGAGSEGIIYWPNSGSERH